MSLSKVAACLENTPSDYLIQKHAQHGTVSRVLGSALPGAGIGAMIGAAPYLTGKDPEGKNALKRMLILGGLGGVTGGALRAGMGNSLKSWAKREGYPRSELSRMARDHERFSEAADAESIRHLMGGGGSRRELLKLEKALEREPLRTVGYKKSVDDAKDLLAGLGGTGATVVGAIEGSRRGMLPGFEHDTGPGALYISAPIKTASSLRI